MNRSTAQIIQLIKLDELIEEKMVVRTNDYELTCFASIVPYKLMEGSSYPVKLNLLILNDYHIEEIEDNLEQSIIKEEHFYAYSIKGILINGSLYSCGFIFEDETFESEYAYLDGKTISIYVDRINVEFLHI